MELEATSEIQGCSFEDVQPIWKNFLWPDRQSPIEKLSAIDAEGKIDVQLLQREAFFWKCTLGSQVIGVVSAQVTNSKLFRSRGLWVHPDYRGLQAASRLMQTLFDRALVMGAEAVWTMPRKSALGFYQKMGFQVYKEIEGYEFGPHLLAEKKLGTTHGSN